MIDIEDLRPPAPRLTPELLWVLQAAFAVDRSPVAGTLAPTEVWQRAVDLALTERIGARRDAAVLPRELRRDFRQARARAAAVGLHYESIAREVAEVAARLETPVVFLKGLALVLTRVVPAGGRSLGDLDILVPAGRAEALYQALLDRRFAPAPAAATEQHLPELRPPDGGSIEVHFALRGVQIADDRPAGLEELADRGALVPLDGFPGSSHLPTRQLLAAHLLVHGFQQHLLRPATYPLFRMIADLIDIMPGEAEWRDLARLWLPAIDHGVSAESLDATRELCATLRAGELPDPGARPKPTRLLHHLLAGALDRDYADSLRGAYLRDRLGEAYRRRELGGYLKRKIRPLWKIKRP